MSNNDPVVTAEIRKMNFLPLPQTKAQRTPTPTPAITQNQNTPVVSPGPDGILNILLKYLSKKALVQLSHIYNQCIKFNYFPTPWKAATLIRIMKPNKEASNPDNYHPISLLNGLGKIYQRIITNKLNDLLENNDKLNANQFGFRAKRNTTLQLHKAS